MNRNHPIPQPDMVGVVLDRLHALYLRCYDKLARKPQHVADVKAGKRPATFVKHRRDYWAMRLRGADVDVILEGIDELRAEVASWKGVEVPGCVVDLHVDETSAEGRANRLVLIAQKTDAIEDLEKAYAAQSAHTHKSSGLARALGKRLAQKRVEFGSARRFFGINPNGKAS